MLHAEFCASSFCYRGETAICSPTTSFLILITEGWTRPERQARRTTAHFSARPDAPSSLAQPIVAACNLFCPSICPDLTTFTHIHKHTLYSAAAVCTKRYSDLEYLTRHQAPAESSQPFALTACYQTFAGDNDAVHETIRCCCRRYSSLVFEGDDDTHIRRQEQV